MVYETAVHVYAGQLGWGLLFAVLAFINGLNLITFFNRLRS